MENPTLDTAIIELLKQGSLSEFKLIKALQSKPYQIFNKHVFDDDLSLFQTHFIVYNALFRLRDIGLKHHIYDIDILPTQISKIDVSTNNEKQVTSNVICKSEHPETEKLRVYYLNWDNFYKTGVEQVEQLINNFWHKMGNISNTTFNDNAYKEALNVLEFTNNSIVTQKKLKQQFHKLSFIHHPDKGGSKEKFQKILFAYEYLRKQS